MDFGFLSVPQFCMHGFVCMDPSMELVSVALVFYVLSLVNFVGILPMAIFHCYVWDFLSSLIFLDVFANGHFPL